MLKFLCDRSELKSKSKTANVEIDPTLTAHAGKTYSGPCPDRSVCQDTTSHSQSNHGQTTVSIDGVSTPKSDIQVIKVRAVHYLEYKLKEAHMYVQIDHYGERKTRWFKHEDIEGVPGSWEAIEAFIPRWASLN